MTGATAGLGLEAATELARKGAHLVIGARNKERASRAKKDVR